MNKNYLYLTFVLNTQRNSLRVIKIDLKSNR